MTKRQQERKPRKTLTLTKETVRRGLKLANIENRNFSNLVEALVAREYDRRFPEQKAA